MGMMPRIITIKPQEEKKHEQPTPVEAQPEQQQQQPAITVEIQRKQHKKLPTPPSKPMKALPKPLVRRNSVPVTSDQLPAIPHRRPSLPERQDNAAMYPQVVVHQYHSTPYVRSPEEAPKIVHTPTALLPIQQPIHATPLLPY